MSPHRELMERLAAADPLPQADRLTPDEQREADELLERLVATPVAPERRARPAGRRSLRRWALAGVATTCAALVAFAAAGLLDSDAPGPDVLELAVAAVSDDDAVYHVVERVRLSAPESIPRGNRRVYIESWHTTDGRLHRRSYLAARDGSRGRLFGDFAGRRTPGRRGGPVLTWSAHDKTINMMRFGTSPNYRGAPALDPYADPGAALRAFEDQGRLRLAGTTDVDGARAYRLVSGDVKSSLRGVTERVVFLVDADSYLPLATHFAQRLRNGDRLDIFTRYLVYERLPLNARTRAKLDLDPHPGAKCAPHADRVFGRGSLGFPNPCAR
jgi:hypothetical protein